MGGGEADWHDKSLKSVGDFSNSSYDTDHFLKQTQWINGIPVYRVLDDFQLGSETSVSHKTVEKAANPVWDSVASLFILESVTCC